MKKKVIKSFKIIGVLLTIFIVFIGVVMYKSVNYEVLSLKVDKSKFPEVTTEADIEKLAEKLVSEMTFEEKVDQMYGEKMLSSGPKLFFNFFVRKRFPHVYVGGNERLNIPPWVLSDGPRGARVTLKSVEGVTTFPVAMARGASWDVELESRINEVIAIEMRANKANYAATPCINLLRSPLWGRAQETYGEDPWHLGEFGVAAVKAIEKHNVMACPKHFAINSIENSRFVVDVKVSERTLREVYLPHFKKTIQVGKPASLMSAYNLVNGEYCSEGRYLLTDILHKEWGFEGFVSSDWVNGTHDGKGIETIKAGLEVEMPFQKAYTYKELRKGIENNQISELDIDTLVLRSLKTRLKYAFAEDKMDYSQSLLAQPSHIKLAKEAAEKSMVLLKNNNILPFKSEKNKKIAVLGRLSNQENTGDDGSSDCHSTYVVTHYQGIKAYNEPLGNEINLYDGSDVEVAKKEAKEADEVILVVGYSREDEGEYLLIGGIENIEKSAEAGKLVGKKGTGGDRESFNLREADVKLIEAVASVTKNFVVVYVGGSGIDMSVWENKVPAILFSWYAGMEGGNALANILYGKANPSGKLPFSIARNVADYPYFTPYTKSIDYGYYHGYTLFEKKNLEIAYPFGFGLSYSTFEFSNLSIAKDSINKEGKLQVTIDVTNTGAMAGEEVVQLYIGFKNSAVDRPVKLLRAFDKIDLEPTETKTVALEVLAKDLAWYNPELKQWEIEAMEYELFVGNSSDKNDLIEQRFTVEPKL